MMRVVKLGLLIACLDLPGTIANADDTVTALLAGVREIAAPGIPGPLCVFGENCDVIATGTAGDKYAEAVVATARWQRGRIVVFGHGGYFGEEALSAADTGTLVANAARWAAGEVGEGSGKVRVLLRRERALADYLSEHGFETTQTNNITTAALADCDIVCADAHGLSDEEIETLQQYVRKGGGLLTAGLAWGWLQLNPGRTLDEHPGNRLLGPAGILFADGYLERSAKDGYAVNGPPSKFCHAGAALAALAEQADDDTDHTPDELAHALWTASRAARTLPDDDRILRPALQKLQRKHAKAIVPTEREPVTMRKPLERLLLTLQIEDDGKLPPARVKAHPAAADFPGAVPADTPRIARTLEIDTNVPGWHSTGLYAPAGEVVNIIVPKDADGAKLSVRIGAHKDGLWDKPKWNRCPDICRSFPLAAPRTAAASAFGGLIYIDVPANCQLGTLKFTITKAVEAPYFALGETSVDEWREKIRKAPAPWAELAGHKIIVTVPSNVVRDIDDPTKVLALWDRVADACADLAAIPRERKRPERYVADRQISAGYMHSGYPIMTHLDAADAMAHYDKLAGGNWGLFHELGHNHQSGDWTFGGAGEVTCNLFTLCVYERVCGKYEDSREQLFGETRAKKLREYCAQPDFNRWKSDPFLALLMYMQIKEAFGWDAFSKTFADYRELSRQERPGNDDEKRDQWLVRLSHTVNRNLGPFFEAWGVPTSQKARAAVANLPTWMPEDFPPQ